MPNADATSAFLLGRLMQQGRRPEAMLKATPGSWRGFDGGHVLAVSEGLLWLACPRLLGNPDVGSTSLREVGGVEVHEVRGGRRGTTALRLHLRVGDRTLKYTVLEDAESCRAFVTALQSGIAAA